MTDKQSNWLLNIKDVIDALPQYVLIIDRHHHILLANKSVQSDLGVETEKIIGKYCPMVIHGSDKPIHQCPLEEAVREGCAVEREYFDEHSNRWFLSAIYPIERKIKDGQPVYFHMVRDITDHKKAEDGFKRSLDRLQKVMDGTIQAITSIVEKRDPYTAGHQQRVSRLAYNIAREMNVPYEQAVGVRIVGLVHDIGKIAVPIEILSKPGRISLDELNIIKKHPQVGYSILKEIEFPWPVATTVLQHHERLNGTGYPNGLLEKDIILEARILIVADVIEAMVAHRPYRPALGIDKALEEITINKGILYDPKVVDACITLFNNGFSLK